MLLAPDMQASAPRLAAREGWYSIYHLSWGWKAELACVPDTRTENRTHDR